MKFLIQVNVVGNEPEIGEAAGRIRDSKATVVPGPLNGQEYANLVDRSDVVIQPHDPEYYTVQTSGVFAEARGRGAVSIVPDGTTMAEEVNEHGGGVVVRDQTVDSYAGALRLVLSDFDSLKTRAKAAALEWQARNSPSRFLAQLTSVLPPTHQL